MEKPQYIDWIVEETGIVIKDDIPLKCYKIDYKDDESILDDWALHIRRNYIDLFTFPPEKRFDDFEEITDGDNLFYTDRKSTRLNSSHVRTSRMPSSA